MYLQSWTWWIRIQGRSSVLYFSSLSYLLRTSVLVLKRVSLSIFILKNRDISKLPSWTFQFLVKPPPIDKGQQLRSVNGKFQGINLKSVLEWSMSFNMDIKDITAALDFFDPTTVGPYWLVSVHCDNEASSLFLLGAYELYHICDMLISWSISIHEMMRIPDHILTYNDKQSMG